MNIRRTYSNTLGLHQSVDFYNLNFARGEFEHRLARARELMRINGLDALFVTGVENFSYFTGVPIGVYNPYRPWSALIPLDKEPTIIASSVLRETTKQYCHFENINHYAGRPELNFAKTVAQAMRELGPGKRKIGCELGDNLRLGIPYITFQEIARLVSDAELLNATDVFWELRSLKSSAEIELIRKASDITGKARQEAFSLAREGMTEHEYAQLFAKFMIEEGASRPFFIYVNAGPFHSLQPCPDRKFHKGDIVWVDGGASYRDYLCDFNRIACVGRPAERQVRLHNEIVEATHSVIRQIIPGQRICEVYHMCKKELEKMEKSLQISLDLDNRTQHMGHAQGMEVTEFPFVAPYHENVLREGMVFSLEPGIVGPEGVFIWEDLLAVTNKGVEMLSTETPDLIQI